MSDPTPGWYADPTPGAPPGRLRWWDGTGWTGHVFTHSAPAPGPMGAPAPGYAPPTWAAPAVRKKTSRTLIWSIVAVAVVLIGSCGALIYSVRDDISAGFNAAVDDEVAGDLCTELEQSIDQLNFAQSADQDRATLIERENSSIQWLLTQADQQLLSDRLSAWTDAWRQILERRVTYALDVRAEGEAAARPSLLLDGEALDSRIRREVPGCVVPFGILDDFSESA